jgi:hypothetical protein
MKLLSSNPLVKFELRVHYSLHHFDQHSVQRPSSLVALKLMDFSRYRLVQWRRRDPLRHGSQISFVSAVMDPNVSLSFHLSLSLSLSLVLHCASRSLGSSTHQEVVAAVDRALLCPVLRRVSLHEASEFDEVVHKSGGER